MQPRLPHPSHASQPPPPSQRTCRACSTRGSAAPKSTKDILAAARAQSGGRCRASEPSAGSRHRPRPPPRRPGGGSTKDILAAARAQATAGAAPAATGGAKSTSDILAAARAQSGGAAARRQSRPPKAGGGQRPASRRGTVAGRVRDRRSKKCSRRLAKAKARRCGAAPTAVATVNRPQRSSSFRRSPSRRKAGRRRREPRRGFLVVGGARLWWVLFGTPFRARVDGVYGDDGLGRTGDGPLHDAQRAGRAAQQVQGRPAPRTIRPQSSRPSGRPNTASGWCTTNTTAKTSSTRCRRSARTWDARRTGSKASASSSVRVTARAFTSRESTSKDRRRDRWNGWRSACRRTVLLEVDKSRKFQEELGQWNDPASFVEVA